MAAKMRTARLDHGFRIEPQGDGSALLTVRGSGLGIRLALMLFIWLFLMLSLLGSFIFPTQTSGLLAITILPVAVTVGIELFRRRSFTLTVSDAGIQKGPTLYPVAQISEVFIDNRRLKGEPIVSGLVVGGSGLSGALNTVASSATLGIGRFWRRLLASVSYRVNLRFGRKVIRLAAALDEEKARSLFNYLTQPK